MSDSSARSNRPRQLVYPYQISSDPKIGRYYYEKFSGNPLSFLQSSSLPVMPTAPIAQGTTVNMHTGKGQPWEWFTTTAQSLAPTWSATNGVEIALDQVDNESVELVPGGNNASNPLAFVAGTDPNFFFRAKFKIADADGMDQFGIGFRKQEAFAVPTSFLTTGDGIYTDFFLLGFAATVANPNGVRTSSDLNNGGSATVSAINFTWADNEVHELQLRVIGRKPYVYINGVLAGDSVSKDGDGASITAQQTVSGPSFTFDDGDTLVPFIFCRQDAALSPVYLREIEIGFLRDVGKDKNSENKGE